jgi:hypothetical protein
MAIRSASDALYTLIARLPLYALLVAVAWVLLTGMAGLERVSLGTEWFVGNDETTNMIEIPGGASDADLLSDALASGDVARMEQALSDLDARQQARGATPR